MRIGAVVGLTLCLSLTSALCARAQDGEAVFRANCATCHGGSMDGPGAIVARGLLIVNSGYGGIAGLPGNVLLVFGVD